MSVAQSVVVAPFNIYRSRLSPDGRLPRFPDVTDALAGEAYAAGEFDGVAGAVEWTLLGTDGNRVMNEDGISMNRSASDGFFTSYGGGRKVKQWTINESLSFEMNFADATLETMSILIEDGQDVGEIGAGNAVNGVVSAARTTTDSSANIFATGDYVAVASSATGTNKHGTGAILRVTNGGVTPTFEVVAGGRNYGATAQNTVGEFTVARDGITKTGTAVAGPIVITITVGNTAGAPARKELIIGRRGGRLAKAEFAFLFRGAASPYIGGKAAQVEVPRACFNGDRGITMNRANPISYNVMIDCNEVAPLPYDMDNRIVPSATRRQTADPNYRPGGNVAPSDGSLNDPALGGYARILAVAA